MEQCSRRSSIGLREFASSLFRLIRNCRRTSPVQRFHEQLPASTPFTTCKGPHSSPRPLLNNVTTCFGKRCAIACTSHSVNHSCPDSPRPSHLAPCPDCSASP